MKNFRLLVITFFAITTIMTSCKKDDDVTDESVLGKVTIDFNVNKSYVRAQETEVGNFVCDAIKEYVDSKGKTVDFAIFNGGGIRFDKDTRPEGIYKAGDFTEDDVAEMFPFGNTLVIVKVTGAELKLIFEKSVADITNLSGSFMQVSKELKVEVDTLQTAQVVDDSDENNIVITVEGERIYKPIKLNGTDIVDDVTYTLATSNYIAGGGDNFVTFGKIGDDKKEDLTDLCQEAIKYYFKQHPSITPKIEGRIILK